MPTKTRLRHALAIALFALFFAGCANMRDLAAPFATGGEIRELAHQYGQKAEDSLLQEEWYLAREYLKVAAALAPDDKDAGNESKIAALTEKIEGQSDRLYQSGLAHFEEGRYDEARKAFVQALRINPEHKGALVYVVDKLQDPDTKLFEVKKKTDLKEIAKEFYGDPSKSELIAYFNDMEASEAPEPGTTLTIPQVPAAKLPPPLASPNHKAESRKKGPPPSDIDPNLDNELLTFEVHQDLEKGPPPFDIEQNLQAAIDLLESDQFKNAAVIAAIVKVYDPANKKAALIENEAYLQLAKNYEQYEKYCEAIEAMSKVDLDYPQAREFSERLFEKTRRLAEDHYKKGVRHFVNEDLKKAIAEWEATLAIDPEHPKARKDLENAKSLLEKLGNIE
jgi:tetratricopeptide (TPR) repeat protein